MTAIATPSWWVPATSRPRTRARWWDRLAQFMGANGEFDVGDDGRFLLNDDGTWQVCGNCCGSCSACIKFELRNFSANLDGEYILPYTAFNLLCNDPSNACNYQIQYVMEGLLGPVHFTVQLHKGSGRVVQICINAGNPQDFSCNMWRLQEPGLMFNCNPIADLNVWLQASGGAYAGGEVRVALAECHGCMSSCQWNWSTPCTAWPVQLYPRQPMLTASGISICPCFRTYTTSLVPNFQGQPYSNAIQVTSHTANFANLRIPPVNGISCMYERSAGQINGQMRPGDGVFWPTVKDPNQAHCENPVLNTQSANIAWRLWWLSGPRLRAIAWAGSFQGQLSNLIFEGVSAVLTANHPCEALDTPIVLANALSVPCDTITQVTQDQSTTGWPMFSANGSTITAMAIGSGGTLTVECGAD